MKHLWDKKKKIYLVFSLMFFILNACRHYPVGVVKENDSIQKTLFIQGKFFRFITAIQVGDFLQADGKEIAVFSPKECFYFDMKGKLIHPVVYGKIGFSRPEIIIKDRKIFIAAMGGGFSDVGLLDSKGVVVWKYKHYPGSGPEMAHGDLNQDGNLEFYVVEYDGLHALDDNGNEIWKSKTTDWESKVTVVDKGKSKFIITLRDDYRNLRFWNERGRLIREIKPETEIDEIEIINWPDGPNILTENDAQILIIDFSGKVIFRYKYHKEWYTKICPHIRSFFEIRAVRGVVVNFEQGKKSYLAVLTDLRPSVSKAILNIFSSEGELIYQEVLRTTRGLAKIRNEDGSESLLVGDGDNRVWKYSFVPQID